MCSVRELLNQHTDKTVPHLVHHYCMEQPQQMVEEAGKQASSSSSAPDYRHTATYPPAIDYNDVKKGHIAGIDLAAQPVSNARAHLDTLFNNMRNDYVHQMQQLHEDCGRLLQELSPNARNDGLYANACWIWSIGRRQYTWSTKRSHW